MGMTDEQRRRFHLQEMRREVRRAAKTAARNYLNQNPAAKGIRARADVATYQPRPPAMRGYHARIVRMFLDEPETLAMTNSVIAARLSVDVPGYAAPPNLLTAPMSKWAKATVGDVLQARGVAIDLRKANTLSKIKLALRTREAGGAVEQAVSVIVKLTGAAVIVGDKTYPIHGEGRAARVRVGAGRLNLAALCQLLGVAPPD